jgi:hypothetical protein
MFWKSFVQCGGTFHSVELTFKTEWRNKLTDKQIRLIAAIGASAVVAVAGVVVGISQDRSSLGTDASSDMSTGVTVTESHAPTALSVTEAKPGIPAPPPFPPKNRVYPDRSLLALAGNLRPRMHAVHVVMLQRPTPATTFPRVLSMPPCVKYRWLRSI